MRHRVVSVVGGLCLATCLAAGFIVPALAQSTPPAPSDQQAPPAAAVPDQSKVDEYAEAQHALNGPAGNPECVWLGHRVVSLLWRGGLHIALRLTRPHDRL